MKYYSTLILLICLATRTYAQPALIPQPQQVSWEKGTFNLRACQKIVLLHTGFNKEAQRLQTLLKEQGYTLNIINKSQPLTPTIEIVHQEGLLKEGYAIQVEKNRVLLSAATEQGLFYAMQTLFQLTYENGLIPYCNIKDWPAFSWRGYMVDVGRNYQSMATLKQQIAIMAKYKYNIFHFHFTEDVAWRLAIPQYPQLTAIENMTRQKGQGYLEKNLKELITYCNSLHITLVPEIDMPGHSAAFKRAMKTDMQSDSGVAILKNILQYFCQTYDVPYLHIGGDEVHITNKQFLPEITALVHQLGKKTIGWSPGGNVGPQTIRQLWMYKTEADPALTFIDSRHLYINHFDPLESVVTLYYRKIGDRMKEDKNAIGGTLCLWHDRKIQNESDLFTMNPVYPDMLTFAERTWQGGGSPKWTTTILDTSFAAFENRLLTHKDRYFSKLPFPYVKQSDMQWELYGPYENAGDLRKTFDITKEKPTTKATGGTIVLRHWWAPEIDGWLTAPKENTTWYATTKIWSDADKTENFWIGFNNFSRSTATDSPPQGEWDNKYSAIWVNDKLIAPPIWKHGGQKGDNETPLTDEGYEYRTPTQIKLQKGWNTIKVKAPIGSFEPPNWQNPVKWMFTVVKAG